VPQILVSRAEPRRFIPDDLNPADIAAVARLYEQLEERDVTAGGALEALILDWDELTAFLSEARVAAYIDLTCDTRNPEFHRHYAALVETLVPLMEERGFRLKRKVLESPATGRLPGEYALYLRDLRAEADLFRGENVPLLTEELRLGQEFEVIAGRRGGTLRGERLTLEQLRRLWEEPDRATREEAWRAHAEGQLAEAAALDDLFDRLLDVRRRIAGNAGLGDYRDYRFRLLKRFDYSPEDCLALDGAIERHVVPVVLAQHERRRNLLDLETLRPWDLAVEPLAAEPPRPFETVERLQEGCARIFQRLDPQMGGFFREMVDRRLLDLDNRPGKAPGGYMDILYDRRVPFIFMNAVGTRADVDTLLHEGGHAFNYYLARHLPLTAYHFPPSEFGEVGSMAMELLARPYLSEFYSADELKRLLDEQLRGDLALLPYLAMVDELQHWIYTTPEADARACRAKWLELDARFRPGVDWSGLEGYRALGWQILHVFTLPFYFIEYAIAQIASLRLWLASLEDERGALAAYKRALSLGGSRPLPEIFRAAGLDLSFDEDTVRAVVEETVATIGTGDSHG
jgi:oligoendopeptidase F